ncbi:MAG: hypothetical protein ACJA0N_000018 [Pseudohongiellaceae bacterium]
MGPLNLGYSVGTHDNLDGSEEDYDYLEITYQHATGLYATYGSFDDDFDGDFMQFGYGATVSDIDLGVAVIFGSEELSQEVDEDGDPSEDQAIIFTIGKSFDL